MRATCARVLSALVLRLGLARARPSLRTNGRDAVNGNGEIVVSVSTAGSEIEIRVSDTGPGLAPEDHDKIFEPFFTRKEKGTGLGLAIAKKIAEGHGGKISVASRLGQGTTFTVACPAAVTSR